MVGRDEKTQGPVQDLPPTNPPSTVEVGATSPRWASSHEPVDLPVSPGRIGPGSLLFGRHRVVRKLGGGGMGDVWLVRLDSLDCERVVKLIVSGIATDAQARARFRAEARTMAGLSHPNVVVFHDAVLGSDHETSYIEMEYIRGTSLEKVLQPGLAMPVDQTLRIALQLCDALEAVHARGIVHRDLKPSNLMLLDDRPDGREWLKVLDFGIAKALLGQNDDRTATGGFIGSYAYASPEQIEGRAGITSDLYATGVLLFQMLTGHRPFVGPMAKVLHDHLHQAPPPFGQVRPDLAIPPCLEAVVRRCLAKDPATRPGSALELAEALEQAIRADPPSTLVAFPGEPRFDDPIPKAKRPPRRPDRRKRLGVIAGALTALAASAAGIGARAPRPTQPPKLVASPAPSVRIDPKPDPKPIPPIVLIPSLEIPPQPPEPPVVQAAPPVERDPEAIPAALRFAGPANGSDHREGTGRLFDGLKWPPPTLPAPPPEPPKPPAPLVVAKAEVAVRPVVRKAPEPPKVEKVMGMALVLVPTAPRGPSSFYLGTCEVRQGTYQRVTGRNPSLVAESAEHPVTNVSWLDALRFCNELSGRDGRANYYRIDEDNGEVSRLGGDGYRLPTSEEWAFACGHGRETLYSFGNDLAELDAHAWYRANSQPLGASVDDIANRPMPHAVGLKRPNGLKIHDLHGNAAEWCWDPWERAKGSRVVKGGSFDDEARDLRATGLRGERWSVEDFRIGFRVARDASTASRPSTGEPIEVDRYQSP